MLRRAGSCCARSRKLPVSCHLLMDCAYEGNETRQLALDLGFIPSRAAAIRSASSPGDSRKR